MTFSFAAYKLNDKPQHFDQIDVGAQIQSTLSTFNVAESVSKRSDDGRFCGVFCARNGGRIMGEDLSAFAESEDGILFWDGYWFDDDASDARTLIERLAGADRPGDIIAKLGGSFVIYFYNKRRRQFYAWNALSTFPAMFWVKTDDYIAFCRRQDVLLKMCELSPGDYSSEGLGAFILTDHFLFGDTGPRPLKTAPPQTEVSAINDVVATHSYADDWTNFGIGDEPFTLDLMDEITHSFIETTRRSAAHAEISLLGLSGGKDSRVVLAGLVGANVPFVAQTSGWSDHPDVEVAKLLAERTQIPLNEIVSEPDESMTRHVYDPEQYFCRSLAVYDGHCLSRPTRPNVVLDTKTAHPIPSRLIAYSGTGGEILRGGYALAESGWIKWEEPLDAKKLHTVAETRLLTGADLLTEEIANRLREQVRDHVSDELKRFSPKAVLERLYMDTLFRTRFAPSCDPDSALPLADARLLRLGARVSTETRASERIQFELVRRLTPAIADVPTARFRWGFERLSEKSGVDAFYEERAEKPMIWGTRTSNYPYYFAGTDFLDYFKGVFLDPSNVEKLAPFIDIEELKNVLLTDKRFYERNSMMLWNVLAGLRLIDGSWLDWTSVPAQDIPLRMNVPWHNVSSQVLNSQKALAKSLAEVEDGTERGQSLATSIGEVITAITTDKKQLSLPTWSSSALSLESGEAGLSVAQGWTARLEGEQATANLQGRSNEGGLWSFEIETPETCTKGSWLTLEGEFTGEEGPCLLEFSFTGEAANYASLCGYAYDIGASLMTPFQFVLSGGTEKFQFSMSLPTAPGGKRRIKLQFPLGLAQNKISFSDLHMTIASASDASASAIKVAVAAVSFIDGLAAVSRRYKTPADEFDGFLDQVKIIEDPHTSLKDLYRSPEHWSAVFANLAEPEDTGKTLAAKTSNAVEQAMLQGFDLIAARLGREEQKQEKQKQKAAQDAKLKLKNAAKSAAAIAANPHKARPLIARVKGRLKLLMQNFANAPTPAAVTMTPKASPMTSSPPNTPATPNILITSDDPSVLGLAEELKLPPLPEKMAPKEFGHNEEIANGWRLVKAADTRATISIETRSVEIASPSWSKVHCADATAQLWRKDESDQKNEQKDRIVMRVELHDAAQSGSWIAVRAGNIAPHIGKMLDISFCATPSTDAVGKLYVPIVQPGKASSFSLNSCFNIPAGRDEYRLSAQLPQATDTPLDPQADIEIWFPLGVGPTIWQYEFDNPKITDA